ncbi:MAG: hypothetical protein ABSG21_11010 [Spirochaetia bacterium]|jgi:hypothetical protein
MVMTTLVERVTPVNPIRTRTAVFASFLVLSVLPASGQQQDAGAKAQCTVFTIQDFSAGAENRDYEQPITASISAAFEVGGFGVIPPEKWGGEAQRRRLDARALLAETAAVSVAQAVGAALAVTGYFTVEDGRIYISLQCWDVGAGALAAGLQQTARFNIAFYSSLHDRVAEMLPRIRLREPPASIAAGAVPEKRQPTLSDLTFVSPDEGMEVFLAGDTRIGAISGGKLEWQSGGLALGARFSVEKRKVGFHTSFEMVRAAKEIRLSPLESEKVRAVELDWTLGQLLGLGAALRLYTRPDSVFFSFGNYFYLQPPLSAAGSPVVHDDASIGLGAYLFFPPSSPFRFGVSTGAGWILSVLTASGGASYADGYLDVFNWWVETKVLGPVVFLRQEWKFTTGGTASLLGANWMMINGFPIMTLGVLYRW